MGAPAPVGCGGWDPPRDSCGGKPPHGAPEGFLFVATKRNPSDSKEKNAFGAVVRRGIVFTTRFDIYKFASLRFMPD